MKYYFSIIAFLFLPFMGISQCTFEEYEKYISDNCFNCNQSEENLFIYNKCTEADSTLSRNKKRLNERLKKDFHGTFLRKYRIKRTLNNTFESLKSTRKRVFSNYNYLTKEGYNNYYIFLFYWYYTDKMNEIITDMETTLFGDIET